MDKIHPTHPCAAFSSGDFGQEAVVVCLSCAAYTCGKVYALAEACKPHLAAKADRKRVLTIVKAGAHPGNNRKGWKLAPLLVQLGPEGEVRPEPEGGEEQGPEAAPPFWMRRRCELFHIHFLDHGL